MGRGVLAASAVAVPLLGLLIAAASARSWESRGTADQPAPVRGAPLRPSTGLRLVVAAKPPLLLDLDAGRARPVPGVGTTNSGVVSVVGVGGRAAVVVVEAVWRHADLYGLRGRGEVASKLGTGADVTPAPEGRSVWVRSVAARSRCALRQVAVDGRELRPRRAFPCARTLYPGGSLGLVVNRTRVIEPATGRTVVRTRWGVVAAAGKRLVLAGPDAFFFTLLDAATGTERRLRWPKTIGGLDAPAVDPRGRFVALAFANPSWAGGQALDVWLLDTETARLAHLPGMPALVSLKRTSMAWTDDGRLVMLGESGGRDFAAVWRPGEPHLAVKTVRLPGRETNGSDSFAILR